MLRFMHVSNKGLMCQEVDRRTVLERQQRQ